MARWRARERGQGQNSVEEVQNKDLLKELNEKESTVLGKRFSEIQGGSLEKRRIFLQEIQDLDADESLSDSQESEESEDETEALMRELEAIKRERAEEALQKEDEEEKSKRLQREQDAISGNPLISSDFKIKKRWDDDVIFKNQAVVEDKPKKRFINDLLRSDFHRKFMSKCTFFLKFTR